MYLSQSDFTSPQCVAPYFPAILATWRNHLPAECFDDAPEYRASIAVMESHFGATPWQAVDLMAIVAFLRQRKARGASVDDLKRDWRILASITAYATEAGHA